MSKLDNNIQSKSSKNRERIFKITMTGMLSALSTVLMFLSFSVPFMPSFIKFDLSELPALIATFALGPVEGVIVCLVKNLINMTSTTTGGVGEFANFLLGASFVLPAGIIYKVKRDRKWALIGSLVGVTLMAIISFPINYFVTYPMYAKIMPIEIIVNMYKEINPNVDGLAACLLVFNVPFTFFKGLVDVIITFLIYKRISWIFKLKTKQ